jgi:hypothetical protein
LKEASFVDDIFSGSPLSIRLLILGRMNEKRKGGRIGHVLDDIFGHPPGTWSGLEGHTFKSLIVIKVISELLPKWAPAVTDKNHWLHRYSSKGCASLEHLKDLFDLIALWKLNLHPGCRWFVFVVPHD